MIRKSLLAALAAALLLSGCVATTNRPRHASALPPRLVGQMEGDTVETIPGGLDGQPMTVFSIVRSFDHDGWLAVCGAVVLVGPQDSVSLLEPHLLDARSELVVGNAVSIPPRFMRRYKSISASGALDAERLDLRRIEGDCLVTELVWKPEYRSRSRLELGRGGYALQMVPTYSQSGP